MGLDRIDHRILASLQNNARLSNKELAGMVGLAPSSCLARVRRLTSSGALRSFRATLDPAAIGVGLQAVVSVQLHSHSTASFVSFEQQVLELNEVVAVYNLAGADDFLVHVAVRGPGHLHDFVMECITSRGEVRRVETNLIFEYHSRPMPIYTSE
ncbi:MAG: DNA-binding Lrp family transcriptional regulator [Myxococcota bacterium]